MAKGRRAIVRFEDSAGERVSWAVIGADGASIDGGRHAGLEAVAAELHGLRTVLLVPGTEVLLTEAAVPSRNRRQIANAVPYALEENLIDEVEKLHFAIGSRQPSGLLPVAVVGRERLQRWLNACEAAGLSPDVVAPDVLAVPETADGWSALLLDGTALIRTGRQSGFAVEQPALQDMLRAASEADGGDSPAHITLYRDNRSDVSGVKAAIERLGIHCTDKPRSNAIEGLLDGFTEAGAINLLQDAFAARRPGGDALRPWRVTFALAALWLALELGLNIAGYHRLAKEQQTLQHRTVEIYRATFPEARRVVDPKVQMERHLQQLRGGTGSDGGGFMTLLDGAAQALAELPGGRLRGLSYRGGRLDLELTLADMRGLDRLKRSLGAKGGLSADILSATTDNGQVDARLRLSPGGEP